MEVALFIILVSVPRNCDTSDEALIPFHEIPAYPENKLWVFEDNRKPTMVKKLRTMKRGTDIVFFGCAGQVKLIEM